MTTNKTQSKKEPPEVNLVYKEPLDFVFPSNQETASDILYGTSEKYNSWCDFPSAFITSSSSTYAQAPPGKRRFYIGSDFAEWLAKRRLTEPGAIFYFQGNPCLVLKTLVQERAVFVHICVVFYILEEKTLGFEIISEGIYKNMTNLQSYFK